MKHKTIQMENLTLCVTVRTVVRVGQLTGGDPHQDGDLISVDEKEVIMTQNQIAYWTLKESERANRAKEHLTGQDVETRKVAQQLEAKKLAEVARHNRKDEMLRSLDVAQKGIGTLVKGFTSL